MRAFVRFALVPLVMVLFPAPAVAGNWYFGLGYVPTFGKTDSIGTPPNAKSYLVSGELRAGWEYEWYFSVEGRLQKSAGYRGNVHSSYWSPSGGVLIGLPRPIPRSMFLTGGVTHISAKANLLSYTKDANGKSVTNFTPYPSYAVTTWYAGGGFRFCDRVFCPRVEAGYRGSDLGGFYSSIGIDFRIP